MNRGLLLFACFFFCLHIISAQDQYIYFDPPLSGNQISLPVICTNDSLVLKFKIFEKREKVTLKNIKSTNDFYFLLNGEKIPNYAELKRIKKKDRFSLVYKPRSLNFKYSAIEFQMLVNGEPYTKEFLTKNYAKIISPSLIEKGDTLNLSNKICGQNPLILFKNEGTITLVNIEYNDQIIFDKGTYFHELLEYDFSDNESGLYEVTYRTHSDEYKFVINYQD